MAGCRGACKKLKYKRGGGPTWFNKGVKRCSECNCFFATDRLTCECCGRKLKIRSQRGPRDPARM